MIVVSDASPLITLANIEALDVFPRLFTTITVPSAVEHELAAKGQDAGVADVLRTAQPWLLVRDPLGLLSIPKLDAGELAAISLAVESNADWLLIDERSGRKTAGKLGVPILGTVGILYRAALLGMVDLDEMFFRLKTTTFHYPDIELDKLLADFHKRRNAGD